MTEERLLRLREVIGDSRRGISGLISMSRATWYRGIQRGKYPRPVKISDRSVAWRLSDIQELIRRLAEEES